MGVAANRLPKFRGGVLKEDSGYLIARSKGMPDTSQDVELLIQPGEVKSKAEAKETGSRERIAYRFWLNTNRESLYMDKIRPVLEVAAVSLIINAWAICIG